jgi:hypothetical protein
MVDVLDGYLTMWEAAQNLEALRGLGVVEPTSADQSSKQKSGFDVSNNELQAALFRPE